MSVTPAQAQYVLDRLLAERRITTGEVNRYLVEIGQEIADIERKLTLLRAAAGERPRASSPTPPRRVPNGRHPRTGNRIQGSYMGYMRQVRDETKKAEFRALKDRRGYEAAIAAIRHHLGK